MSLSVNAANVGVSIKLADGSIYTDCVNIDDGKSAYHAFGETELEMEWSNFIGVGYFLDTLEGVGTDGIKYWSFWHGNDAGSDFQSAMIGASDYDIGTDDKIIGFSFTAFDASFNPITRPTFYPYDELCVNPLEVTKIYAYVDGEKETVDENDRIDVKPGSELRFIVKVKNDGDVYLDNVEAEIIILDLDDDMEESSDSFDLKDGRKDELEIVFDIPLDVEEDDYAGTLTVVGEADLPFRQIINFEVQVDKNRHELLASVPSILNGNCGRTLLFDAKIFNIGTEEEDSKVSISNSELNIFEIDEVEVSEDDNERRTYSLSIPRNVQGEYSLKTRIEYSDESEEYSTILNVVCENMELDKPPLDPVEPEQNNLESEQFIDSTEMESEESNLGFILALIVGNVLLVALLVGLIIK